MRRVSVVMAVLLLIGLVVGVASSPAYATVSGTNGRIAFVKEVDGAHQIITIDPDGSDPRLVAEFTSGADELGRISDLSWSPTGTALAFSTADAKIWIVNADGTGMTFMTDGSSPSWSPDGYSIALPVSAVDEVTGLATSVIGVLDLRTDDITAVTKSIGFLEPYPGREPATTHDSDPVWYPDGTRMAFIRRFPAGSPSAGSSFLYEVELATDETTELSRAGWAPRSTDTSSVGDRVVFVTRWFPAAPDDRFIAIYDPATQDRVRQPIPTAIASVASFAPDGETLVAELEYFDGESAGVWVRDSDGGWEFITEGGMPVWQPINPYPVGLVDPTEGQWHLRYPDGHVESFYYGNPGDYPFMGDWDCDGIDTTGLYRQSDGYVYLRDSNSQGVADRSFFFGNPGDVPLSGDFNGDGCDSVSIYRPSEQRFYIVNHLGTKDEGLGQADVDYVFGNPGDTPFVGDFNGDGIDTAGLHRASTGLVYYRNTHSQGAADNQFLFGDPADRFITNDWNSNGIDSPAVFRPSNTTLFFRFTNTQGTADARYIWGEPDWQPVTGIFSHE